MPLRLAFMGTPEFAVSTLDKLSETQHEITCVYTRPPRPKGRGLTEEKSPVHRLAESKGLEVRTPASLRTPEAQVAFSALDTDATIVVAYGLILPKTVLNAPRLGCFNLHASLLPRWRGAAPMQRAIMACDPKTGVMVMRMEEALDTGPVLLTERVQTGHKTYGQLHDELKTIGAELVCRVLEGLEDGTIEETPQSDQGVTYAKKLEHFETRIDWKLSARILDCVIRGLSPKPGAWFEQKGERIKILLADPVEGHGSPGEFLEDASIACGEGALAPVSVQRAGRSATDWQSFLRGFPLQPGDHLD